MFSGIGVTEILFILALLTLVFGAKRIPEIARGLGSGIRNFKGAIRDGSDDDPGDAGNAG
ncbi:MAG: twin-arginine translocase TatA/TatE family subunit [Gemmatimonadetes bacterium]|nr:twin-arginine translocase TatA/TatE family subunit [Gemmatimonadota bacterium]